MGIEIENIPYLILVTYRTGEYFLRLDLWIGTILAVRFSDITHFSVTQYFILICRRMVTFISLYPYFHLREERVTYSQVL